MSNIQTLIENINLLIEGHLEKACTKEMLERLIGNFSLCVNGSSYLSRESDDPLGIHIYFGFENISKEYIEASGKNLRDEIMEVVHDDPSFYKERALIMADELGKLSKDIKKIYMEADDVC